MESKPVKYVLLILLVLEVVLSQLSGAEANKGNAVTAVVEAVDGTVDAVGNVLSREGSLEFLGHLCQYKVTPNLRGIRVKYRGKFWCPGWVSFEGTSPLHQKRIRAWKLAIKNFAEQALGAEIITSDQFDVVVKTVNNFKKIEDGLKILEPTQAETKIKDDLKILEPTQPEHKE